MILENLHSENWKDLKSVVGIADHVPDAVVKLLSEDADEVEAAYWKLENHVVVQGDLSESAAYLPKYLEEVLLNAKYKGSVIELLFQIGNGISLDEELQKTCYSQVVEVFERVINHSEIKGTKWESAIKEDLQTLRELHEENT